MQVWKKHTTPFSLSSAGELLSFLSFAPQLKSQKRSWFEQSGHSPRTAAADFNNAELNRTSTADKSRSKTWRQSRHADQTAGGCCTACAIQRRFKHEQKDQRSKGQQNIQRQQDSQLLTVSSNCIIYARWCAVDNLLAFECPTTNKTAIALARRAAAVGIIPGWSLKVKNAEQILS